jgi:hypothetical protein
MGLGTSWVFLVAILKEDLWRKEMLSLWVNMSERKSEYIWSFLTTIFCVCHCPVWGAGGRVWRRLGASGSLLRLPCKASGCIFSSSYMSCVHQVPGKWLKWIRQIKENGWY